jgi:hypothetical protein
MLIEAGLEPDLDSNPEKFRRSLEGDIAQWTPIVSSKAVAGCRRRLRRRPLSTGPAIGGRS